MAKQILIVGGYGNLGYFIADFLVRETKNVVVIIGGKSERKAISAAQQLCDKYHTERLQARRVDASNIVNLVNSFSEVDMVIDAGGTLRYSRNIIEAALGANIDYMDTHFSVESKTSILRSFEKDILDHELCYITDAGAHPGMPAAMVRQAASWFDELYKADVVASVQHNWNKIELSQETLLDAIEKLPEFRALAYRFGDWRNLKWREYKEFDFGKQYYQKQCYPVYLEEMELLPGEFPTLEETGFFYPGFNWFVDYIVIPLIYLNDGIFGGGFNDSLSKMLVWGLRQFTDPPYSGMVRLDAIGKIDGKIKQGGIKISHHDLHYMAAVPVVACLLQYLERKTRLPGIWYQASFVEPKRFFEDISRMGVTVEYNPPAGIVDKPIVEDEILSEVR